MRRRVTLWGCETVALPEARFCAEREAMSSAPEVVERKRCCSEEVRRERNCVLADVNGLLSGGSGG